MLTYAIGDIHGCVEELRVLLELIRRDADARNDPSRELIFLGDYVHRGPDSLGVAELVTAAINGFEVVLLPGNHEEILMAVMGEDPPEDVFAAYCKATRASLVREIFPGIEPSTVIESRRLRTAFCERIMHVRDGVLLRLLGALGDRDYYQSQGFIFVHAGIDPSRSITDQDVRDFTSIRERFTSYSGEWQHPVIVHGHTPTMEPRPRNYGWRVNVDSGCYHTGVLSAAVIHDGAVSLLAANRTGAVELPAD